MNNSEEIKKLVNEIRSDIERGIECGHDHDFRSWEYETGVILTGNQAKMLCDAIESLLFRENDERPKLNPSLLRTVCDVFDGYEPIKCATFDQSLISPEVRERMDADRAEAERIKDAMVESLGFPGKTDKQ